jgi:hypothetical protein
MASPFQKFGGNIGPDIDVYRGMRDAQKPIEEGIANLAKGVGQYMSEERQAELEREKLKKEAAANAEKMAFEREKFALERQKVEEARRARAMDAEAARIKFETESRTEGFKLQQKQNQDRYDRNVGRLDLINSEIGGFYANLQPGQQLSPEDQERVNALKAKKDALGAEIESNAKALDEATNNLDNLDIYRQRTDSTSGKGAPSAFSNEGFAAAQSTGGAMLDPLSSARRPDGSIDYSAINFGTPEKGFGNNGFSETPLPNLSIYGSGGAGEGAGPQGPTFLGRAASGYPVIPGSVSGVRAGVGQTNSGSGGSSLVDGQLVQQPSGSGLNGLPIESQPIGSNPLVTDIGSAFRNSNAYVGTAPIGTGGSSKIVFDNGTYKLEVSPDAGENNRQDVSTMASIVAFANTMTPEQAINLSGLVRADKNENTMKLFRQMKEKGLIPPEMDIIKFKAATAASLYRDGGSSALGTMNESQANTLGAILAKNPGVEISPRQEVASPASSSVSVVEYRPAPAEWTPPFDVDRTARLARSGNVPFGPRTKAQFEYYKALDAQAMAKNRLLFSQQQTEAAVLSAQSSSAKTETEASREVGNLEALVPGIGNSRGGTDLLFFNRTLGQESPDADISLEWRRVQGQRGNLAAWNHIRGTYGINEKQSEKFYEQAREATADFEKGFNAAAMILGTFQQQEGKNWAEMNYERITGGGAAVAAQYRLFLIGAFRKPTVGLGNPSNFEQELLLNLVPDPTTPFQITSKSVAKSKMLVLLTVANHLSEMENSKFVPSEKSAAAYSKKLREAGVIGADRTLDVKAIKEFKSILQRNPGDPEGAMAALRSWAISTQDSTLSGVISEATSYDERSPFIRGGSPEARKVASGINRFFEESDPNFKPKSSKIWPF